MEKLITIEYLHEIHACKPAMNWLDTNRSSFKRNNYDYVLRKLVKLNQFGYANWLITQLFNGKQRVQYAVFAAEQVLHIFEKKYPEDNRPRQAIQACNNWLENPCHETAAAARAAAAVASAYTAAAARAAADAAYTAYTADAADAAAYASVAAAARAAAARAANATASYAVYAADDADDAAVAPTLKLKIIKYGIKLLNFNK